LQRDWVVHSSEESNSDNAGTKSEYDDSNKDNNANSNGNNSVVPQRQLRKKEPTDTMKDARELFS
jgi:hypothetical protein